MLRNYLFLSFVSPFGVPPLTSLTIFPLLCQKSKLVARGSTAILNCLWYETTAKISFPAGCFEWDISPHLLSNYQVIFWRVARPSESPEVVGTKFWRILRERLSSSALGKRPRGGREDYFRFKEKVILAQKYTLSDNIFPQSAERTAVWPYRTTFTFASLLKKRTSFFKQFFTVHNYQHDPSWHDQNSQN